MESIIVWIIGIVIYLLIGWGAVLSYDYKNKSASILTLLFWPVDLGSLIELASKYYSIRINIVSKPKADPEAMLHHVYAIREKVEEMDKVLHSIEEKVQKNGEK